MSLGAVAESFPALLAAVDAFGRTAADLAAAVAPHNPDLGCLLAAAETVAVLGAAGRTASGGGGESPYAACVAPNRSVTGVASISPGAIARLATERPTAGKHGWRGYPDGTWPPLLDGMEGGRVAFAMILTPRPWKGCRFGGRATPNSG